MESIETNLPVAEQKISSRRAAILMGGAALAGLALTRKATAQSANIDLDILNFALNLEYLEANFYTLATQGKTIDQVGIDITGIGVPTGPLVTPGVVTVKNATTAMPNGDYSSCIVPFTDPLLQQFANEVAADELNHVTFLRTALGSSILAGTNTAITQAVAQPNIDLVNSFTALALAAGVIKTGVFDPFASETNFLLGAFIFEDVGVSAYLGAAGLLTNPTYLDKAAGILAVEAYHAGSIRTRIFGAGAAAQAASQAIATLRSQLDGVVPADDIGVGVDSTGAATVVDADSTNAIAFSRLTIQVRQIVYADGAGSNYTGKGGFFPTGMNGSLT